MCKNLEKLKRDIVEVGKLIYQKGWVAANDGNISIRLDDNSILCTPTRISKGMMSPDDMIVVDMNGNKIAGERGCTSEIAMHLTIYKIREDVQSVVHAHPPVSTGFASAGRALDLALLPEVVVTMGSIPLAEYGLPGTPALTEGMMPFIPKYDAILMANHGAVCYGEDVFTAYFRMETMEHFARITLVAELLGGAKPLPRVEVEKLFAARERYCVVTRSTIEPGAPVVAEDIELAGDLRPKDKIELTRDELVSIIDEALRARGVV